MSLVNNSLENAQIIDALVRALAFSQENTIVGRVDMNDLTSPIVPKYNEKTPVIKGELRQSIEDKIQELVKTL